MSTSNRKWGDRKDGQRLRHTQSVFAVSPHIMKRRSDALVYFDEFVEIEQLEKYVRQLRKEKDLPVFSLYHLIIAAATRMLVLRPQLNRFVLNGKLYARNHICSSMTVKRELHKDGDEAVIKPYFEKTDTVFDIYHKINDALMKEVYNANNGNGNDTDIAANILNRCPAFVVRAFVNLITFADHRNWLTGLINQLSPFHTSFYITDVGSIGIDAVYHHLYDFGTTSIFLAIGKKQYVPIAAADGTVTTKKVVRIRFVVDERICDGHYYAESFRMFKRLLKHPEQLEVPPTDFPEDTWI